MTPAHNTSGEEGAVLVEVLVAFVILVAVVTAGFQIFTDGLRRSAVATERAELAVKAAELLSTLKDVKPGTSLLKDSGGQDFTVRIAELQADAAEFVAVRPVHVEIFAGTTINGPPLAESIILTRTSQ